MLFRDFYILTDVGPIDRTDMIITFKLDHSLSLRIMFGVKQNFCKLMAERRRLERDGWKVNAGR
jgi:hypothetical protein